MGKRALIVLTLFALVMVPSYGLGAPEEDDLSKLPKGDLPGWKQVLADDFEEYGNVPEGSFSDCANNQDNYKEAYCAGLPDKLKDRWWAYPKNWPDTAKERKYPLGGVYNPEKTISISDGQMKVRMFREQGENQVAALVPKATVGQTYGRYVIRFKTETTPGYKIAWLLWPDGDKQGLGGEIDFPEAELDLEIAGFMHHKQESANQEHRQDSYQTGQKLGGWHTAVIEWTPGKVQYFLDGKKVEGIDPTGKKIDASTVNVPDQPMSWIIQSESALDDRAKNEQVIAKENSETNILIDWVAAYTYTGDQRPTEDEQSSTTDSAEQKEDKQPPTTEPQENPEEQSSTTDPVENQKEQQPSISDDKETKDGQQDPPPNSEEKKEEEQNSPDETEQGPSSESEQKSQEDSKNQPKISIFSTMLEQDQVQINGTLENVKDPKGTWKITLNNGEPKTMENEDGKVQETFSTKDFTANEVPVTVEFDGLDGDKKIQSKITEKIKVKDETAEEEKIVVEEVAKNQSATTNQVGGKLPQTATNYSLGILLGFVFMLSGWLMFRIYHRIRS